MRNSTQEISSINALMNRKSYENIATPVHTDDQQLTISSLIISADLPDTICEGGPEQEKIKWDSDRTLSVWLKTAESCLLINRHKPSVTDDDVRVGSCHGAQPRSSQQNSDNIKCSQKDKQIKIVKEGLGARLEPL